MDKINTDIFKVDIENYVAKLLLFLNAVKLQKDGEEPFLYTGGNRGPIYIDNRVLISHNSYRKIIAGFISNIILDIKPIDMDGFPWDISYIAGGATAGMPFAQDVADMLGLPYFYIREKKKEHGISDFVVGDLFNVLGKDLISIHPAVLVEDLITDGKSKEHFIEQLRKHCWCADCVVIFDREQGGREKLKSLGVELYSLTTMSKLLDVAFNNRIINSDTYSSIKDYLKDPRKWNEDRGFKWIV